MKGISRGEILMTWQQIKSAVDRLGIGDNEEILVIKCEQGDGNQTLHQIRIGKFIILAEDLSDEARKQALGCCV
jgi:hypothetical protein